MEKISDGRRGKPDNRSFKRPKVKMEHSEHPRKQAKVEEGPEIEIKTSQLASFIAFLLFVELIPCFFVQFRCHKKLILSKSKHGSQQQDFRREEERMEILQSEYS